MVNKDDLYVDVEDLILAREKKKVNEQFSVYLNKLGKAIQCKVLSPGEYLQLLIIQGAAIH